MKKFLILIIALSLMLAACGTDNTKKSGTQKDQEGTDMSTEKSDLPAFVSGNNQLGLDLLSLTMSDHDDNLFISPSSLYMALSLIYNGADGETKKELKRLLHFEDKNPETFNTTNQVFIEKLTSEKEGIELQIANSIWLNELFHFQTNFKENVENYYHAKITEVDMADAETANEINQWVENQTNERIKDIVEPPLDPELVSILVNTIYFDGDWQHPFEPELTTTEDFQLSDGSTKDVEMMMLSRSFDYFETGEFQAVSLPYGQGDMSMQLYLPNEEIDFETFQKEFTIENWEQWQDTFTKEEGQVKLPSFELEYETSFKDVLYNLGMTTAFDSQADFTKMVEETEDIWISDVKQKTFLLVDEEGTEAAAATSIEVKTTSMPTNEPFNMELNRPFLLFIKDETTGAILFTGKIANPPTE